MTRERPKRSKKEPLTSGSLRPTIDSSLVHSKESGAEQGEGFLLVYSTGITGESQGKSRALPGQDARYSIGTPVVLNPGFSVLCPCRSIRGLLFGRSIPKFSGELQGKFRLTDR